MIYYTADLHFGHANIIEHDDRPFKDVDEMDRVLIEYWNKRVQPSDIVYIVGDFCFRSGHPADWYLRQLKGHKTLIVGNHDKPVLNNPEAVSMFDRIDKIMNIKDSGKTVCLCHYPLAEWNSYYDGGWHIFGHIHNNKNEAYEDMKKKKQALNAGCMINNYMPVTFDELVKNNLMFKEMDI